MTTWTDIFPELDGPPVRGLPSEFTSVATNFTTMHDDAQTIIDTFKKNGGQILETIKAPLANPDFAPFLQRAADAKPDAIFVFVPSGQGATFMKQYTERGLDKAGIKVIGTGDVTDDDLLPQMGDAVIGAVTAHMYSADYNIGKEALRALTRTAAREWAGYGITANIICPAAVSAAYKRLYKTQAAMLDAMAAQNPMGRMGDPHDDIAPVVAFLVSDEARYMTGNTLFVDGGGHINGVAWAPNLAEED